MLRVDVHECPLEDDAPGPFVKSIGLAETRPEAVAIIEAYIKPFHHKGTDSGTIPPYWWCRNDGDAKRKVLLIVGV